jgi:hypothetical protein
VEAEAELAVFLTELYLLHLTQLLAQVERLLITEIIVCMETLLLEAVAQVDLKPAVVVMPQLLILVLTLPIFGHTLEFKTVAVVVVV